MRKAKSKKAEATKVLEKNGSALTYAGIFVLALATLMLEVLLTRITSVMAWYHLAFFVISLAMLGLTAGAVLVFLWPGWFTAADIMIGSMFIWQRILGMPTKRPKLEAYVERLLQRPHGLKLPPAAT